MFFNQRYERDMYEESKKRKKQQKEEAYSNGSRYQRAICNIFDDAVIKYGNKTVYTDCEFISGGKDIKIICRAMNSDFGFFESKSRFEDAVRGIIREKIRDNGYNTYPLIYFRYC